MKSEAGFVGVAGLWSLAILAGLPCALTYRNLPGGYPAGYGSDWTVCLAAAAALFTFSLWGYETGGLRFRVWRLLACGVATWVVAVLLFIGFHLEAG